jgi:hypothetical protein
MRAMPRRRSLALVAAACVLSHLVGGGTQTQALLTDSESTSATITTATCFVDDDVAPVATSSVISKTTPYLAGAIGQGDSYRVYANVTDGGCVPSGVATVTADVSTVTSGQTAVALSAGAFSAQGVSYGYRSAILTANATLSEGLKAYSVHGTDVAGNSQTTSGFSVRIDDTRPSATDVQATNGGSAAGKPELGDTIVFTYFEQIDPESILAGWTGASTSVVVRITDPFLGIGNDILTIRNAANSAQLPFGDVDLASGNYVSATRNFGATGTPSTMVQSGSTITITLGTPSGTTGTETASGTMSWSPSSTATDAAANACTTTARSEGGAADREF